VRSLRFVIGSGIVCSLMVQGAALRDARAEAAPSEPTVSTPNPETLTAGFEVLAQVGYGAATSNVRDLEIDPYRLTLGLDLGYSFRSGFRLGAKFGYGFGTSIEQRRQTIVGTEADVTAAASSATGALSLGYDVPIFGVRLRYSFDMGVMAMDWSLEGVPPRSLLNVESWNDPAWGFFIAPGALLLWQRGAFELGGGFDYVVQISDAIPVGMTGKLVSGVKW
jgi:hypothetical protein